MLRSLFSGVSGLRNHQDRMDVIGNNIANVNTTGFKYGRVNFADQVSQLTQAATAPVDGGRGGVNAMQVGLGVQKSTIDTVMTQGNLETTGKVTDVAIQGDGFFVTADGPNRFYTRAGNFDFDRQGNMVSPGNGLKVMGWAPTVTQDPSGLPVYSINNSSPIQALSIPAGAVIPPRQTSTLTMKGNLDQRAAVDATGYNFAAGTTPSQGSYFDTSTQVFDSLGNQHFVTVRFVHQASNGNTDTWNWGMVDPTAQSINNPAPTVPPAQPAPSGPQPLVFDKNGLLTGGPTGNTYTGGGQTITWKLPDGTITSGTVVPSFGDYGVASGVTQFATAATAVVSDQNGYTRGELTGISVDKSGILNGIFSNGQQQLLGQLAIATFTNPGGLVKEGDNSYVKTNNSGDAVIRAGGQAEAGTITSGALEMSNVDLAQQFSDMIITQRGFQANSKVITTSDEMLQELINLKR